LNIWIILAVIGIAFLIIVYSIVYSRNGFLSRIGEIILCIFTVILLLFSTISFIFGIHTYRNSSYKYIVINSEKLEINTEKSSYILYKVNIIAEDSKTKRLYTIYLNEDNFKEEQSYIELTPNEVSDYEDIGTVLNSFD
jgi:hypothetical protein